TPTPNPPPQAGRGAHRVRGWNRAEPARRHMSLVRNRLPVLGEMLRRAPSQRLGGERGIVSAAGAHHRGAEDAEGWHLVRKAVAVDYIGLAVVAHAGAAVGVGRGTHGAHRPALDRDRARLHEPLRHLVLDEDAELLLVVLVVSGDADHGEAER